MTERLIDFRPAFGAEFCLTFKDVPATFAKKTIGAAILKKYLKIVGSARLKKADGAIAAVRASEKKNPQCRVLRNDNPACAGWCPLCRFALPASYTERHKVGSVREVCVPAAEVRTPIFVLSVHIL